jgi:predicted choloylglycine hydrolase
MFDTIGEAFKRLNEYYIQLIDDLTRIQDYIKHTDEAINSDEKHSYVFMSLNAL